MRTKGVSRSKQERQVCLRILQSKSLADRQLRASLGLIAKIWSERTDPQDPWLVLRDKFEAQALEALFRALEVNWVSVQPSHIDLGAPSVRQRSRSYQA